MKIRLTSDITLAVQDDGKTRQTNIQVCLKNEHTFRFSRTWKSYHPESNSQKIIQDGLLHKKQTLTTKTKLKKSQGIDVGY